MIAPGKSFKKYLSLGNTSKSNTKSIILGSMLESNSIEMESLFKIFILSLSIFFIGILLKILNFSFRFKKALVDGISEVLKETLNVSKEDVYCLFRETPAHNHYTGGKPLPEWVPSDE